LAASFGENIANARGTFNGRVISAHTVTQFKAKQVVANDQVLPFGGWPAAFCSNMGNIGALDTM
jgi:hypothetical protein